MPAENPQSPLQRRLKSFVYAFQGGWYVFRTQPNAWIHALITLVTVVLSWWLNISRQEWAILILTFMAVWIAEFMNTALEVIVDLVSPDYHPQAQVAKDVAAGAVLVAAVGAVLIGLLILGLPLLAKFCNFVLLPFCP